MNDITTQQAHLHFAALAFNRCWELIELESRTPEQDREMIRSAETSFWHWQACDEKTPLNDAIGYWQLARAYTLARCVAPAVDYALAGLEIARTHQLGPFYLGYAWESLGRAYALARRTDDCLRSIGEARSAADQVEDQDHQSALVKDIDTIQPVAPEA